MPRREGGRNCPRSHCQVVARPCSFPALSHRVGDMLRSGRLGGLLHAVCCSPKAGSTCQALWACWHDQALPSISTQRWLCRRHHRDPSAGPLATVMTVGWGAVLGWAPSSRRVLRLGGSLSLQQVRDRVTLGTPRSSLGRYFSAVVPISRPWLSPPSSTHPGGRAAALLSGQEDRKPFLSVRAWLARGDCSPGFARGRELPCVGSAHGPPGWVLDVCPLHGGTRVGPSQPSSSQPGKPGLGGGPWLPQPRGLSGARCVSQLLQTLGWHAHGGWGPALGGQGLLWEAGMGAGPGREGGSHARACRGALWPEASCAVGRPEARGEPSTWPFSLSKMGRPSEGCACDQKLRPCGTVACFSVVTLGAAWRER